MRVEPPDWDAYRVFLRVVERGSFSSAATDLGISQPTASRRVDDLEQALGTRLLVRRSRGVVPTATGERVAAEARHMATSANAATRMATGGAAESRRVRITATEGIGALWLPQHLAAIRGDDPHLAIELVIDNAATDLSARHADIAIRLFKPRQPDLVAKKVGAIDFGFYASAKYLAKNPAPKRLDDLERHDHVGFSDRGTAVPTYMRWLRKLVPEDRFVTSATSLIAMIELARAGHGLVLTTTMYVDSDRDLVRVLPRARPPAMDVWLATHVDVHRDPDVAAVMERLAKLFAEK